MPTGLILFSPLYTCISLGDIGGAARFISQDHNVTAKVSTHDLCSVQEDFAGICFLLERSAVGMARDACNPLITVLSAQ